MPYYFALHSLKVQLKIALALILENTPFGVQLEVYEFVPVTDDNSRLNMHVIYETAAQRDQVLKLPFAGGLNMAHNRTEEIMSKLK